MCTLRCAICMEVQCYTIAYESVSHPVDRMQYVECSSVIYSYTHANTHTHARAICVVCPSWRGCVFAFSAAAASRVALPLDDVPDSGGARRQFYYVRCGLSEINKSIPPRRRRSGHHRSTPARLLYYAIIHCLCARSGFSEGHLVHARYLLYGWRAQRQPP